MRVVVLVLVMFCGCSFEPPAGPGSSTTDGGSNDAGPGAQQCNPQVYDPDMNNDATEWQEHRYALTEPLAWSAAEAECRRTGGHLLVIETGGEDQFGRDQLSFVAEWVWIGLHDPQNNDSYVWIQNNQAPSYENWDGGQKPMGPENCITKRSLFLDDREGWYARDCNMPMRAVCECDN